MKAVPLLPGITVECSGDAGQHDRKKREQRGNEVTPRPPAEKCGCVPADGMQQHREHGGDEDDPNGPGETAVPVVVRVAPSLVIRNLVVDPVAHKIVANDPDVDSAEVDIGPSVPQPLQY